MFFNDMGLSESFTERYIALSFVGQEWENKDPCNAIHYVKTLHSIPICSNGNGFCDGTGFALCIAALSV